MVVGYTSRKRAQLGYNLDAIANNNSYIGAGFRERLVMKPISLQMRNAYQQVRTHDGLSTRAPTG